MLARSSCGALSSSSSWVSPSPGRSSLGYRLSRGDRATTPVAMPGVVDEVRAALADQYYRPVPASVLQLGSVDRMISALGDPYTAYLAPIDYSLLRQQTESRYSGIGVSVLPAARGLVVVSLRPGPAERAGVRAGDTIVSIDGVAARHLDACLRALRGCSGRRARRCTSRLSAITSVSTSRCGERSCRRRSSSRRCSRMTGGAGATCG